MTAPQNPCVTQEDQEVCGAIMDALWPILGGDMLPSDMWHDIGAAVTTALRQAVVALAPACDAAWDDLPEDDRDNLCFDWDFVPSWLRDNLFSLTKEA